MKPKPKASGAPPPTITKGQQDVTYQELIIDGGERLRIRIRSDSYKFQSFGRVERWDGAKWQEVWSIPPLTLAVPEGLAYFNRPITAADFAADRRTLLDHAAVVLGEG